MRKTEFRTQASRRRFAHLFWAFALGSALLLAAGASWRDRPIAQWTQDDARQILNESPWAKFVTASIIQVEGEDVRRASGKTGQDHGIGFDGISKLGRAGAPANAKGPTGNVRTTGQVISLRLRWETALPIRAAELKAGGIEPASSSDGYSIAVYGIPGTFLKGDPKTLGEPLKKDAVLKRTGKKDVKPFQVEVFQREEGVVVVYTFPLSTEISREDAHVEFAAQIGRIVLDQSFNLEELMFQGKLEL